MEPFGRGHFGAWQTCTKNVEMTLHFRALVFVFMSTRGGGREGAGPLFMNFQKDPLNHPPNTYPKKKSAKNP